MTECLKTSATRDIPDFTVEETDKAISTLVQGKASGTDRYPPDIFIAAGPQLRSHITSMFNRIKNQLEIPDSWFDIIVATIFKNKGSKKLTKYYRGVFLACVIYKIFEKLVKQRVSGNLERIDLSQAGARINKGPGDSMFVFYATKDHALYLNSPLYVTFYDYTTCFDSLWLEDSMLSLWNLGIQDKLFNLIFILNQNCNIVVKTAHGTTSPTTCPNIVKQGTVLSGNLCTSSTGELNRNLSSNGASIITANIKASLFVDDTWTPNTNVLDSSTAHHEFVMFTKRKRLGLNDKCVAMAMNLKKDNAKPVLKVNGQDIEFVKSTKCLGDMVSSEKSNRVLIDYKLNKGKAAMVSILAMCDEMTFGIHYVSTGLLLYRSVFIPSLLFNCDVWTRLSNTDLNRLQLLQLKVLKRVTHLPNSTSNPFIFLELGILPIKHEINKRKLMFLYHINTLSDADPVKKIHIQQKNLPFEQNWTNEVNTAMKLYNINADDISTISRNVWKNRITSRIHQIAFVELQSRLSSMTKTKHLEYASLNQQEYVTEIPAYLATLVMKIRSKTLACRTNHTSSGMDRCCRLCHHAEENQEHTINCYSINGDDAWITLDEYTNPNGKLDLTKLEEIHCRHKRFLEMVDEMSS